MSEENKSFKTFEVEPIGGVVFTECGHDHLDWFEEYYIKENEVWELVGFLLYNEPPKTEYGNPRPYGHFGVEIKTLKEDLILANYDEIPAGTEVSTVLLPIARVLK